MEADRVLRAVRRARRLNQRELAAATGVARTTIERIEGGRHTPSLATVERILSGTAFRLAVVDADGAPLLVDDVHDQFKDGAGRRLPAHLNWNRITEWDYETWWAWYRYVPGTGMTRLMPLPAATYHRRTDPRSFKAYLRRVLTGPRRERDEQPGPDP